MNEDIADDLLTEVPQIHYLLDSCVKRTLAEYIKSSGNEEPINAYIYASGKRGVWLTNQVNRCLKKAKDCSCRAIAIYKERTQEISPHKPKLEQMLADIATSKEQDSKSAIVIIVDKPTSISSDVTMFVKIMHRIEIVLKCPVIFAT